MRIANKVMKIPETHTSSTFSKKTSKGPESAVFVPESAVFPTYDLEVSRFFRNFAKTMEVFLRVWAAAQQSSSELGSAAFVALAEKERVGLLNAALLL